MTMITSNNLHQHQQAPKWEAPPQRRDTAALDDLFAVFPSPAYNFQIRTFVEMYADEWLEVVCCASVRTRKLELIRKPKDSQATLANSRWRLVPYMPGLYSLRLTINEHYTRLIHVGCWPRSAETKLGFGNEHEAFQRRMRLRAIIQDSRVQPEHIIDSLENDDPMFGLTGRIVGGGRPIKKGAGVNGAESSAFNLQSYYSGGSQ